MTTPTCAGCGSQLGDTYTALSLRRFINGKGEFPVRVLSLCERCAELAGSKLALLRAPDAPAAVAAPHPVAITQPIVPNPISQGIAPAVAPPAPTSVHGSPVAGIPAPPPVAPRLGE